MLRPLATLAVLSILLPALGASAAPSPVRPAATKPPSSPTKPSAPTPTAPERYAGFDLDLLAKALAKLTTLRTQYGEAKGKEELDRWLESQGLSRASYDQAYSAWWMRFKADASGELQARFLTLNAQYTNEANFADSADRSQEKRGGLTLDRYAEIAVALSRPPLAEVDHTLRVLRKFGIKSLAEWQKANDAWVAAMREDTTFALTQQYANLYQRHAGPSFAQEQERELAKSLAADQARGPAPRTARPQPPAIDEYLAALGSKDPAERWRAARGYAHLCDLWSGPAGKPASDPVAPHCSPAALKSKLLPVMLEAVGRFDDETVQEAVGLLDFFAELELKTPAAKAAIQRARERSAERLRNVETAFAPIEDKAVPERVKLRAQIDMYTAALRDFDRALAGW